MLRCCASWLLLCLFAGCREQQPAKEKPAPLAYQPAELFRLLAKSDPAALEFAEMAKPESPGLTLVLALWQQSRGDLIGARKLFARGLTQRPEAPVADREYASDAPQIAYAALML